MNENYIFDCTLTSVQVCGDLFCADETWNLLFDNSFHLLSHSVFDW